MGPALELGAAARPRPAARPLHPPHLPPPQPRGLHPRRRHPRRGTCRAARHHPARGPRHPRHGQPGGRPRRPRRHPEGWAYATLYPSLGLVREVADATGHPPGTPVFDRPIADDARSGRLVRAVHRAVEEGDALAADTLLRVLIARLLNLYGTTAAHAVPASAGRGTAARARDLLAERLTDPPSLEELARTLGSSPFAVLRAFKAAYGMPPHTWLTDARVRRARALLHSGATPAETATAVGFTDQPHLNRHFTRIVGVTPGAYRRARRAG